MGNCMASECITVSAGIGDQFIRIVRADGKVLEYKAPISVKDLLSGHQGHTVVHLGALHRCVRPNHKLVPGELYYLLPSESEAPKGNKRTSCNENKDLKATSLKMKKEEAVSSGNKNGVVRLKVVITKQELAELLSESLAKGASMEDLLVELKAKGAQTRVDSSAALARTSVCGWSPALDSIPEDCHIAE
eukprot:Gb_09596 [translate_table: standard]